MRWIVLLIAVLAAGCSGQPETVRIVHVGECHEVGNVDQYTIIEFPDGTRRLRFYHWGKVGDTFKSHRAGVTQ